MSIEGLFMDEAKKLTDYLSLNATSGISDNSKDDDDVFEKDPFFKDPLDFFDDESGCKVFMFQTLGRSNIRIWDLLIFIPNLIFFVYLVSGLGKAHARISASNAPVYRAFFYLILFSSALSVARCLLSIILGMIFSYTHAIDELGWVLLHFGLLTTELSVVVLGITQIDSRKSVRRIILLASILAVFYSILQSILEIKYPDPNFQFKGINLFGFGGSLFLFFSATLFLILYGVLLVLPCLKPCHKYVWALPQKRSFYIYVSFLLLLNLFQMISTLVLIYQQVGLCLLNTSLYLYFTLFIPSVYFTFLRGFFQVPQPSLLFSYKAQMDEETRQSEFNDGGETAAPGPIIINSRVLDS